MSCRQSQRSSATSSDSSRRRGTILVAVLIVVTISALAGTTAMYYGEAAAAGSQVSLKRTRSRAMAWSGIQAVMAELDTQRESLLNGEAPLITTQWQLFESDGKRGIVRLVSLEKDEAGLERWVVSESARLDLNSATAEMLAKLGPLSEDQAAAIVSARDKGYFSVEELVRVPGVGELVEPVISDPSDETPVVSADEEQLASLVTVFGFDPNIQAGIDPGGADARGKLRVNLNTPWSEELGQAIGQRFGANAVSSAKALFDAGEQFKTMADLVAVLKRTNLPVDTWPPLVDAFTVSPDPFIPGRVDINRASARVLGAIPGISSGAAEEIVRRRQGLDAAIKRSVVWPLSQGILKEDEFVKAMDWMTTRSMQWRVRVEVGVIDVESSESNGAPELQERMVLEAVIDVASERPRVAYLRDATLIEAAHALSEDLALREESADPGELERDTLQGPTASTGESDTNAGLDMDASLKLNTSLDFGSDPTPTMRQPSLPESGSGGSPVTPAAQAPAEGKDRRIGRWTSRGGLEAKP